LVIVRASGKGSALADKRLNPGCQHWVRQIPVAGLHLWTGRGRTGYLSAFWVDLDEACDLMTQRLGYRRPEQLLQLLRTGSEIQLRWLSELRRKTKHFLT
jgi:hypothetical protein